MLVISLSIRKGNIYIKNVSENSIDELSVFCSYSLPLLLVLTFPGSTFYLPPCFQIHVFYIFKAHWIQLCFRCGLIHWVVIGLPETTPLKKIDPSCLSSYQLSISPQLEVEVHCFSLNHAGMLTFLILCKSCAGIHSYYDFMVVLCPENTVSS